MQKNVNQLKVGVVLSYFSRFIQLIVGIIYTPIMIRLLGQSEYGLYNIAASTIAYLGVLNFGFGSAYMRYYSRYKVKDDSEKIAVLNGMFLTIFSILGLIVVIAGLILAMNVDIIFGPSLSAQELITGKILILILVVNLAVSFPVLVFNTNIQANEKFIFKNAIQIGRQITTPLINLPILIAGYGSIGMVIGTVSVNIIIEIFLVSYSLKKLKMKFSFRNFDFALMKEMTVFSSYVFLNIVFDLLNQNLDKTLLGRYSGTISVAIYSIGANLKVYYQQFSTAIYTVFVPRIHRMVSLNISDIELTKLFTKIGRVQFILLSLIMSGFIFLGKPFISIWAGTDYLESYPIAMLLMSSATVPLIQNIGIEIQRAKNMHQFRTWSYMFIAIGNLIISIPLVQSYGALGGALGTFLAYIIGHVILMNWYYHFRIGLDMIYFWKQIIDFAPVFIGPIIYGYLINQYINLYILQNLLFFGMIYVVIFGLSMWFIGMNEYEKNLIKNPIISLIKR